jgi:hypothetical protein
VVSELLFLRINMLQQQMREIPLIFKANERNDCTANWK